MGGDGGARLHPLRRCLCHLLLRQHLRRSRMRPRSRRFGVALGLILHLALPCRTLCAARLRRRVLRRARVRRVDRVGILALEDPECARSPLAERMPFCWSRFWLDTAVLQLLARAAHAAAAVAAAAVSAARARSLRLPLTLLASAACRRLTACFCTCSCSCALLMLPSNCCGLAVEEHVEPAQHATLAEQPAERVALERRAVRRSGGGRLRLARRHER
mmetsp:Transcript_28693/g.73915  ORF Transcript_28693/g.73915 Transcript_28693/m.73915 type:complete len:218 (-) Transcript_28693:13-666(-)